MQLTIVGKSPSWPDAGGACSGYLIEEGGYRLLLDCGPGVFAKVRGLVDYVEIDAVLISHMHGDHFLDLVPFSYALTYSPRQQARGVRPELHTPPGGAEVLRSVISSFAEAELVETAFRLSEYDPEQPLVLGPFTIRFAPVPHFVPTQAVDVTGAAGERLTFSADCGPNDALVALAENTDLLLIEATLADAEADADDNGNTGHLTCAQAGDHATMAHAGRVLLTHFSDEYQPEALLRQATAHFAGPIDLARAGDVYTL